MHVLLIRPPNQFSNSKILSHIMPMNLAYLAGYLRKHHTSVSILDYEVRKYSNEHYLSVLREQKPTFVGVSCMTAAVSAGAQLCKFAKEYDKNILTIIGGSHANALPKETMREFSAFDFLIFGEGEETLLDLCRKYQEPKEYSSIPGIVYRDGDEIVKNGSRSLIADLDSIPFPARDLIIEPPKKGHVSRGFSNDLRPTSIYTSRGCPYKCSFCAIQNTFGNTVRFRKIPLIEQEIKEVIKEFNFNHIIIADDTFALKKDRPYELCDVFARNGINSWSCDTRVNSVTRELLQAMKDSGCKKVSFGVESGSQRILDLIKKNIQVEQVTQAARWAKEVGFKHIEGNFIIGADPTETLEDLALTRKLILSLPWTFVSVSIIVPYPGTPLYRTMQKNNLIQSDSAWEDFVMFGKPPKWRTDNFSAEELIKLQKQITRSFYLRPQYILKQLMTIRSFSDLNYWITAGISYISWYCKGRL
ncbi:MAG: B12-binding domain-containing radical SAM protein [Proteobacteria bacterium]|nr:B12-binding domain-containing radical SAM protein [Pseudomonadota bacterium]